MEVFLYVIPLALLFGIYIGFLKFSSSVFHNVADKIEKHVEEKKKDASNNSEITIEKLQQSNISLKYKLNTIQKRKNNINLYKHISGVIAFFIVALVCWGTIYGIDCIVSKGETKTEYYDDYDSMQVVLKTRTIPVSDDEVCYITNSGEKYHQYGCGYLKSSTKTTVKSALNRGYTPCSVCWDHSTTTTKTFIETEPERKSIEKRVTHYEDTALPVISIFIFIAIAFVAFIESKTEYYLEKKFDKEIEKIKKARNNNDLAIEEIR